VDILILAVAFVVILLGAELFTNGIEWFGRKLNLAQGAVGSVLAAVGTALPETMIPIIAIGFGGGGESTDAVGVGAILGAPFMLSTLAMFVTGVAILVFRRRRATGGELRIDAGVIAHDMRYFAIAYGLAIGSAFLPQEPVWIRWIIEGPYRCRFIRPRPSHSLPRKKGRRVSMEARRAPSTLASGTRPVRLSSHVWRHSRMDVARSPPRPAWLQSASSFSRCFVRGIMSLRRIPSTDPREAC
jgi:hypothetical protein